MWEPDGKGGGLIEVSYRLIAVDELPRHPSITYIIDEETGDKIDLRRVAMVPPTSMSADEAWRDRRDWVFKPSGAFGSRAVYRGDKISRRKFQEIYPRDDFVAQRRIAPGEIEVATSDGPQRMKFDVRAYAYRDEVLLLGARAYQGQVTNFRSPGGGFSAICVSRAG